MQYFKFHGGLPGYENRKLRGGENIDPDKHAFSMAPHDDEAYERVNMGDESEVGGAPSGFGATSSSLGGEPYSHVNPYSADDYDDPHRYGSSAAAPPPNRNQGMFDDNTEYSSGGLGNAPPSMPYGGSAVGAQSDMYDNGPAQFPSGNYDRIER